MPIFVKPPPKPLNKEGPNCQGCPYRSTSLGYVGVEGSLDSQFLFLLENPNGPEVEKGTNLVSSMGTMKRLLKENTNIKLSEQAVASTVRCWPIKWDSNGKPLTTSYSKKIGTKWYKITTYQKEKASPGQMRECALRYTNDLLKNFNGKYFIGLGKIPTSFMLGGNVSIKEKRGTPYVPGLMISCICCNGKGLIERKPTKCKACKDGKIKCEECGRWKHLKKCKTKTLHNCKLCNGTGRTTRKPRTCSNCTGTGKVPKDPKNPFICDRLKEGQIFFPTYSPGILINQPKEESILERDFRMFMELDSIVSAETEDELEYLEFPGGDLARGFVYDYSI